MAAPAAVSMCCRHPALLRPVAPPVAATPAAPAYISRRTLSPLRSPRPFPPSWLPVDGTARRSRRCFFRAGPSGLASAGGFWEDPDDGYGSEHEEVEGAEDEEELEVGRGRPGQVLAERTGDVPTTAASESERLRHGCSLPSVPFFFFPLLFGQILWFYATVPPSERCD